MNRKLSFKPIQQTLGIIAIICTTAVLPALADVSNPSPIKVEISIAGSDSLTLGEPIVLHYKISNAASQRVSTYMGINQNDWLSMKLIDSFGQKVPPFIHSQTAEIDGLYSDGVDISPKGDNEDYVVVSQRFTIPRPGKYILLVHVRLPYKYSEGGWGQGLDQTIGTVYTNDYSFSLTVAKTNFRRLKTVAETMKQSILQSKNVTLCKAMIKALFSMPQASALATWQALANEPSLDGFTRDDIASQLAQARSIEAAAILSNMIWQPAQSQSEISRSYAGHYLMLMYNSGNTALREYIKQIYADHGEAISKKVLGP